MNSFRKAILLFFLLSMDLEAQPLKCITQAKSAILYNPDNGAILFEKDAHRLHYPASTLKIATILFILDGKKTDLNLQCIASKKALMVMNGTLKQLDPTLYCPYILEHDGVMSGLKAGKTYSINSLLHRALLMSGNDAANVLAETCSGTIETFMQELNEYLSERGLKNTRLQNPHGLHHPDQVTTAYDLAQIAAWGLNNSTFAKILKTVAFEEEAGILNKNRFLKPGKYNYPKMLGGKTGYTAAAGYNLVTAAENEGRKLVLVLFGCKTSEDRYKDAIAIFEIAFREKEKERFLFSKDHECFARKIPRANQLLKGRLDQDVIISYFPSEERPLQASLIWDDLELPIAAGTKVGKLVVKDESGHTFIERPLYSDASLQKSFWYKSLEISKQVVIWGLILLGLTLLVKLLKKSSKICKR